MIMISALKLVQSKCKWSRDGAHYQVRSALENAFIAQKRWDVFNHRKKIRRKNFIRLTMVIFRC